MPAELIVRYKGEEQVLRVDDKDIILFPAGLVGFADCRRFVLVEDEDEPAISVLQNVDDTNISFLVADPWYVFPAYEARLAPEDFDGLGLERAEDAKVICTLSANGEPLRVTANLLGPIVINPRNRLARQIVLQDSQYSAQHPVLTSASEEALTAG